jgi:photosystem II stability/assembly factor-like uncharacterized protein
MRRIAPLLALTCAMLAIYTTQAGAATWTQLNTGTTATITSIDYSTGTVIFTTSNGEIFRQSGSGFTRVTDEPGVVFNQVRMNGSLGLAVGNGGAVFRTTDSGEKWAQESSIMADESDGCASAVPLGSVYAIGWASSSEVFIAAANNQIDRSIDSGETWSRVNNGASGCVIHGDITDMFFVPGATYAKGYFLSNGFGKLFLLQAGSTFEFSSDVSPLSDSLNDYTGLSRLAADPANPARQWDVNPQEGSSGDSLAFGLTTDGWGSTPGNWTFVNGNSGSPSQNAYDVAYAGGTVLADGNNGELLGSTDGTNFYQWNAGGSMTSENWRAVALADGAHAAIGGTNGVLAVTADAQEVAPPTPVTPISTPVVAPPTTFNPGQIHAPAGTVEVVREGVRYLLSTTALTGCLSKKAKLPAAFTTHGLKVRLVKVQFSFDGHRVAQRKRHPYSERLSLKKLRSGKHRLTVTAYVDRGHHRKVAKVSLSESFSVC